MHRRLDEFDWARTSVGPRQAWPQSLSSTIKTLLGSRYPMFLLWGPDLVQIYNEAYIKLIGAKHPAALGRSIRETQAESWAIIGPMIHEVMTEGVPNWVPAQCLPLERSGYREESYFSLSYSAVDDDRGEIAGMLCVCSEVTEQVLGERRLELLRDLGIHAGETESVSSSCRSIASVLGNHPLDVPFALVYLPDSSRQALVLASSSRRTAGPPPLPLRVELEQASPQVQPLLRALAGETLEFELEASEPPLPGGPWSEATRHALAIPLRDSQHAPAFGVLVAGRSPNRALDENYASFYELLGSQVSLALRNARAYEDERKRAEALQELDRAKTAFFSHLEMEALRRRSIETTERERGQAMLRFLADASSTLAESLDYPTTLARITRLAVPLLADWCFIDVVNEDGSVARVHVAHSHAEDAHHARALQQFPAATSQNRDNPPTRALLDGQPLLLHEVTDEQLRASSHNEAHLSVMRALGICSFMSVPLEARGRILGSLSFATSTSQRRYGAADLALAVDLAHRCSLAVDNARSYAQAQRALNDRDRFLAIASHELKTPLTPLQLQLYTLERKAGELTKDAQARDSLESKLAVLRRQSLRLERLVNELLDVTRLAAGQFGVAREALDLSEVVRSVVAAFERSGEIAHSGCQLEIDAQGPVVGAWDRHDLEQVLSYLLENAFKFAPGKLVRVEVRRSGGTARLSVLDRGPGIPLEHQARIFDRFERAVPERQYGGLGLGLWLVRAIVEAMGGRIAVESAPQQGATFSVDLPLREIASPAYEV